MAWLAALVTLPVRGPVLSAAAASSAVYAFGHSSGGQFNQVVVSGTNSFHGRLYEYFQNRNLNAVDALLERTSGGTPVKKPRFDNNRFGGQVGGPIIKNKLFFFANWEAYRQVLAQQVTGFVPTAAFRAATIAKSPALTTTVNSYLTGGAPTSDPNALSYGGLGCTPLPEDVARSG